MTKSSPGIDLQLIEQMRTISSSIFADVMEMNNAMDYRVKPVNYKQPLVGRARTVSLPKGDNLFLHHAIYEVEPGDIIVVDGQDHKGSAYLGELMAGAAEALGIQGIVIDGMVRDKRELEQLDIQIYAKGFLSTGPKKEGPGSFDTDITCAGAFISSGDYIVGDEDGVVVIPYELAPEIMEKAKQKLAYEQNRLDVIEQYKQHSGAKEKSEVAPSWLKDKLKKYGIPERD
ncbi:RraA family protein [Planococcus maritimus]|nr:RraA family protein [Planococcus sp. SK3692]MDE4085310.1 RraA family protein [Planococcus maritimus]